ncbi:MAG: PorP/SprF family type IX secretion system membrane protein [Saprospiraceae bacterium]
MSLSSDNKGTMKNSHPYLFAMFFCTLAWSAKAQQLPLFSQYQSAYSLLNPAVMSGNFLKYETTTEVSSLYRYQWTQIEGAPRTFLVNGTFFKEDYNFLIGASMVQDQAGALSNMGANVRAGYLIRFSGHSFMVLGLNGGFLQYKVDGNQLKFNDPDDNVNVSLARFSPDFSFGATYYYQTRSKNYFYVGLSVPQTFGFNLQFRNDQHGIDIQRVRHYYGLLGSAFALRDNSWLEISSWVKYVENTLLHLDLNLRMEYRQILWFGLGGSSAGAVHLEVGTFIDVGNYHFLQIGYGYDHFLQTYGPNFGGGHEINIGFSY